MDRINDCPNVGLVGQGYAIALREPNNGLTIVLTSGQPLAGYSFNPADDPPLPEEGRRPSRRARRAGRRTAEQLWCGPGPRPEGVAIGETSAGDVVCFVEIKPSLEDDHAYEQLAAGAAHFAAFERNDEARDHGDDHHDAWSNEEDVPVAPTRRGGSEEVVPDPDHRICGVIVARVYGTRRAPDLTRTIAGKEFPIGVFHHTGARGEQSTSLEEFLRDAGVE